MEIRQTETFIESDIIEDGVKVGTVELCPERHEITRLKIFEGYQDKGYGTEAVKSLVEQGYHTLWVKADNARAIHVYEKCGFRRCEPKIYEMRWEQV